MVIAPELLDKLELTFDELEREGHPVKNIFVISGFRTPSYNENGGDTSGRGSLSRHMYGDAMDVTIDNDHDGLMDDLNGDGRVDVKDARVLARAAEQVEQEHPDLVGGIGVYAPTGAHHGFVHIDTRGYRARWGPWCGRPGERTGAPHRRSAWPTTRETEIRVERDAAERGRAPARARAAPADAHVREEDLEPHEGLRYIARLFKVLAVLLVLMLMVEVIIGLMQQGSSAIPTLVVEATRLIVFAGFLWGGGDLALMLIESNHDLRATRILMGRVNGKLQRIAEMEGDELERRAANPGLGRGSND